MLDNQTQAESPEPSTIDKDQLEGYSFINQVDRNLRVVASLHAPKSPEQPIELRTQIFYQNEYVAVLNFFLHGYQVSECIHLAQNLRESDYILERIDEFLAGDVVE